MILLIGSNIILKFYSDGKVGGKVVRWQAGVWCLDESQCLFPRPRKGRWMRCEASSCCNV